MTILQEASTKALDALRKAMQGNLDFDVALEAFEALRTALAQQELPQKERPDFMAGYDAGMADAKRMAQQGDHSDQRLVNLLCRIHRDGGHYIAEHGMDKAVRDADLKVAQLNALTDTAAPAPVAQQGEQQCPQCKTSGNLRLQCTHCLYSEQAAPAPACQGGEMTTCSVYCSPASHS